MGQCEAKDSVAGKVFWRLLPNSLLGKTRSQKLSGKKYLCKLKTSLYKDKGVRVV